MANFNIDAQQDRTYDAIVIGSGISGGWAAKELCEKGLKTLVLERGRLVRHGVDYPTANNDPWDLELRGSLSAEDRTDHEIGVRVGFISENNKHFYANDRENPYTEVKPFLWVRAHQMGGRSLLWGKQTYRWSRPRLRGQCPGRHRRRLADPLPRHRALVHLRRDNSPASAVNVRACRSCPTASSCRRWN